MREADEENLQQDGLRTSRGKAGTLLIQARAADIVDIVDIADPLTSRQRMLLYAWLTSSPNSISRTELPDALNTLETSANSRKIGKIILFASSLNPGRRGPAPLVQDRLELQSKKSVKIARNVATRRGINLLFLACSSYDSRMMR